MNKKRKYETELNEKHKDRLFSFIFGREENKAWTLSLFNAVNGSDYDDPTQIEFNTLEDFLYMGMKNDVSFLIVGLINLYEHQSTYNPNMPLRMMEYLARLYSGYIAEHEFNKYGSRLIQLPAPKLLVFYNGEQDIEDETILRLSDSFDEGLSSEADVEVTVRMININQGKNKSLMNACRPLSEYAWFIDKIRECGDGMKEKMTKWRKSRLTRKAVNQAIDEMPHDFEIRSFLVKHRAEVAGMIEMEYDEANVMELFRKDGREEERVNTERERRRADDAEAKLREAEAKLKAAGLM